MFVHSETEYFASFVYIFLIQKHTCTSQSYSFYVTLVTDFELLVGLDFDWAILIHEQFDFPFVNIDQIRFPC